MSSIGITDDLYDEVNSRREAKTKKVYKYVLIISWLMILYFTGHGSYGTKIGELLALP